MYLLADAALTYCQPVQLSELASNYDVVQYGELILCLISELNLVPTAKLGGQFCAAPTRNEEVLFTFVTSSSRLWYKSGKKCTFQLKPYEGVKVGKGRKIKAALQVNSRA